jgi:small subunit ribosomal protein S16
MAVSMRLARRGKRNAPFYHVVVADSTMPRDGRFIEVLGTYDPSNKEQRFVGKKERIEYWLSKGARPSETVSQLLRTL